MSVTHLVKEGCIGDHHGNLTGGIEAVQPPPVSETVESTGPTNHSSAVFSPHPVRVCVCVCVCVCNDPCNFKSSKAAKSKLIHLFTWLSS